MSESLDQLQAALSLDPLSSIINTNYGVLLMQNRRFPEAMAQFQKVVDRDPNFAPVHYSRSHLYATMGRFPEAVRDFRQQFVKPISVSEDARGYLKLAMAAESTDPASVAVAAAVNGNYDLAFEYLEKAYAAGDGELEVVIRFPALDPLRSDPRYADLMRRVGLPQ